MFYKKLYSLGDKLEDAVRVTLSHYPIIYAFIGGAGIVIFWRGIWHTMDSLMEFFFVTGVSTSSTSISQLPWWDGPLSIAIGTVLLLIVGLFVTSFIGNEIIISGLKKEKKVAEKTEEEIEGDLAEGHKIKQEIHEVHAKLKEIEELLQKQGK
jgi:MFS superfamily sulfate permease-like transporter